jgi:hypothetical protein
MASLGRRRALSRREVLVGAGTSAGIVLGGLREAEAACLRVSGLRSVRARMADEVAALVGVNTHVNYSGTVYDQAFYSIVKPRLIELGVGHIRDNPGADANAIVKSRYVELARAGIRLTMVTWNTRDFDLDYVKSLNGSGTTVVEAVEPPNERDNAWGPTWPQQMRSYMLSMHPRYKADPATKTITVLGPSFAKTRDSAPLLRSVFADAASYFDCGNVHDYSGCNPEGSTGGGWGLSLADAIARQRYGSTKPVWATENGYKMSGAQRGHSAVTQRAAAKYLPRQFLCHLVNNSPRLFIYQLMNHDEEDFGLLDRAGNRRLQFHAVKNFIALFKDSGPAFTTGRLSYQLSGATTSVRQLVLQRRDGRFYLILWQPARSSVDAASDTQADDIEPPRAAITITLGTRIKSARLFEPSFSGSPLRSYTSANGLATLSVQVPDHLLVVELMPVVC